MKKADIEKPVFLAGGVSCNNGIVRALKDILKLDDNELVVPENKGLHGSIGAAVIACREKKKCNTEKLNSILTGNLNSISRRISMENSAQKKIFPPLKSYGLDDLESKHSIDSNIAYPEQCFIGIDAGSTSVNIAVVDENSRMLLSRYYKSYGKPAEVAEKGLDEVKAFLAGKTEIAGLGVTGSGRYYIGKKLDADCVKDEITSQATAAVAIDRDVETVIEIGGQDSKYIRIRNGHVVDFEMNRICAAGTGSFIEEQSKKFDIPVSSFGETALKSTDPANLGDRCTVFIESAIAESLSSGTATEDIAAGLCYSICKNYLNKVVGGKEITGKIFLQGGIAFNQGIINAFRALTGKEITVPCYFSVTGAYGIAVITKEEALNSKAVSREDCKQLSELKTEKNNMLENRNEIFSSRINNLFFNDYKKTGCCDHKKTAGCPVKTIGIPRTLFSYSQFSFFNTFFRELGFDVLLSDETSETTVSLSQDLSTVDLCFPMKIVTGHISELIQKGSDYIFSPCIYSVNTRLEESRKNYSCPFMQIAPYTVGQIIENITEGKRKVELLSALFTDGKEKEQQLKPFFEIGLKLGKSRDEITGAVKSGKKAASRFEARMAESVSGERTSDKPVFVIISKIYGVADNALNMGIPDRLLKLGYDVIPFYEMPEISIKNDYPNIYWPFAQRILSTAYAVKDRENYYPVLLTHHGCGPDSAILHYFKEIIGDKPYLNIEIDEHTSDVGIVTRLEAFVNSISNIKDCDDDTTEDSGVAYIPNLYPYSQLLKEQLGSSSQNVEILSATDDESIDIGRRYSGDRDYFSLTALTGDIIRDLENSSTGKDKIIIPCSEGNDIGGQYSQLLKTFLTNAGLENIRIESPFIEDLINNEWGDLEPFLLNIIAGDILLAQKSNRREKFFHDIQAMNKRRTMTEAGFLELVSGCNEADDAGRKKILAVGEPALLFNRFLNRFTLENIEEQGFCLFCSPLSEALWLFWHDYCFKGNNHVSGLAKENLERFGDLIFKTSEIVSTPFNKKTEQLRDYADKYVGYYAGGFGRYRGAKILSMQNEIDCVLALSSSNENTGMALKTMRKNHRKKITKPVLDLFFDSNPNAENKLKLETFLYYLNKGE